MKMKTFKGAEAVKCAVIGYGGAYNMGKAHMEQMQSAGMTPTAVAEIDPSRLEVAKADFPGIATYTEVEQMLAEAKPDIVAIITPHNTHAELGLKCLQAGAGVVCEKPMAITVAECDAMIAAAEANGLLLSVYHNRHWDGCILEAMEQLVRQQRIGDIFRVEAHMGGFHHPGETWRSSRSISGGIHYDWGVHLLEYTLQVVGSEVVEVSGFMKAGVWSTKWGEDTNEDELTAIVRFANGAMLDLRMTTLDAAPDRGQVVFTGTKGKYFMDQGSYDIHLPGEAKNCVIHGKNRPGEQETYYANVADALTGKADLIITSEWSRRTIEVLELASRSARSGRAMRPEDLKA